MPRRRWSSTTRSLGLLPPNNTINIHNSGGLTLGGAVFATDGTGPVVAPIATEALDYATGTAVNASTVPNNFIDITSLVNTVPGVTTASSGFALAMGGISYHSGGGAHPFLMSYYDVQDSEAVLGSVTSGAASYHGSQRPKRQRDRPHPHERG